MTPRLIFLFKFFTNIADKCKIIDYNSVINQSNTSRPQTSTETYINHIFIDPISRNERGLLHTL